MSQIYKSLTSGPVPPAVPTSFVTQDGTAVPAANVLIVNAFDSIQNNDNGIITKGGVVGTGTSNEVDVVLTNRIKVTTTTSDGAGQSQTVTIMTPQVSSGITFVVSITGYDSANNAIAGGELIGIAKRSAGGTTTVVGTNDTFEDSDASLVTADWDIITNGTLIQIQFVGVAGLSISWSAVFLYDQST